MPQGTATVNFGAFPGSSHAETDITGQATIIAGSLAEAWIRPVDSADHLADEHLVEPLKVIAGDIVPGTGFTIHAFYEGLGDTMPYGLFNVAWVWN